MMADEVLQQGVRGITDLMVMPGLINLDFADVRSVMSEMGKAMMGTGEADGDNRAIEAAEQAIANPLLDGVSMKGAKGVIISITGGEDMRLMEVDEAANHIRELVDPDANIIWGSAFNNDLDGKIRVSVVATGIGAEEIMPMPQPAKVFAFPAARAMTTAQARAGDRGAPTADHPDPARGGGERWRHHRDGRRRPRNGSDRARGDDDRREPRPDGDGRVAARHRDDRGGNRRDPGAAGTRAWLTRRRHPPSRRPEPRQAGTLFERMSSIARGAQKAQVPEEEAEETPRLRTGTRDPLDIPRFLNRQNNQ